jgi:ribonuclease P protein component
VDDTPKAASGKFPKSLRLLKHADFQAVYEQGRKHFSGNIAGFFRVRDDQSGPRVGFAVGRRLGGAVDRNRIRRRLRAAVPPKLGSLGGPVDVVLHPRKSVLTMEFSRLENEIERLFATIRRGVARCQ